MDLKELNIRRRIEHLRGEMIEAFASRDFDLRDAEVLRISRLLDRQLNRYDRYVRKLQPGKAGQACSYPALRARSV